MDIRYDLKTLKNVSVSNIESSVFDSTYTKLIYANNEPFTLESNSQKYLIEKDEVILLPPFANFTISSPLKKDIQIAIFSYTLLDDSISTTLRFNPVKFDSESEISESMRKYFSISENSSLKYNLLKKSVEYFIIYTSFSAIEENEITIPDKLATIISYIESNYWQNITVADLSGVGNISESALYKLFTSSLSESPKQYIRKRRMFHASTMLINSDKSIADIAIENGFYDPFYFSKEFKKDFGLSPSEYRKIKNEK